MKSIITYIKEELETDNLLWLLDTWFNNKELEQQEYMDIVVKCINDHNVNNIEKYIEETTQFKNTYKAFVNFILNEVEISKDLNYLYQIKEITKQLIGNKSNKNKYIKK